MLATLIGVEWACGWDKQTNNVEAGIDEIYGRWHIALLSLVLIIFAACMSGCKVVLRAVPRSSLIWTLWRRINPDLSILPLELPGKKRDRSLGCFIHMLVIAPAA